MTAPQNNHQIGLNDNASECCHGAVAYHFAIFNTNFSSSCSKEESKFTLSRVSRSQRNGSSHAKGSGVGWSDDHSIAMYKNLFDCVAKDRKKLLGYETQINQIEKI